MTGPELRAARKAAGLTQVQFAQRLHVTQPTVSEWESGNAAIGGLAQFAIDTVLRSAGNGRAKKTRKLKKTA